MVATRIVATPDRVRAKSAHCGPDVGVALFSQGGIKLPGLGGSLANQMRRALPRPPSDLSWDFLSIALSAFAADRFIVRREAEDGWTRILDLDIAVKNPQTWAPQASRLAAALRFLTGDIWHISFSGDGASPPAFQGNLYERDAICLFSGGLDSLLGALKLQEDGRFPFLVSQGSPKEITPQQYLSKMIGLEEYRFDGRVNERWRPPYEASTRGRSLVFLAYGVVAASGHGLNEVVIPENGLIAVNPPLTRRRIGTLSTRTTHPHFLSELQAVLQGAGINISLRNIFEGMSKGEMLASCTHPRVSSLAGYSYSCGKGKRKNGQCGRCIPCLIRRAAFRSSGVADRTKKYLSDIRSSQKNDDVLAARLATAYKATLSQDEFERWVTMAGPLPEEIARRKAILRAVGKGLDEVSEFLSQVRWR